MEQSLRRPIMLHEFGLNLEGMIQEFPGERDAPTLKEILALVPAGKTHGIYVDSPPSERGTADLTSVRVRQLIG